MGYYDYYDEPEEGVTLSSLTKFLRAKNQGESDDHEDISSMNSMFEKFSKREELADNAVREMFDKLPKGVHIDHETAHQIGKLKADDLIAYYLLFSDIDAAYAMIQRQLKDIYPEWADEYYLSEVDSQLIVDDDDWQKYMYRHELDRVYMPGCSSGIIPILYRFQKRNTNTNFSTEIQFFDIIRMISGEDSVDQTYVIHAMKTANVK